MRLLIVVLLVLLPNVAAADGFGFNARGDYGFLFLDEHQDGVATFRLGFSLGRLGNNTTFEPFRDVWGGLEATSGQFVS